MTGRCTIYAIAESPRDSNVIWVGTDDGLVQLSRDGGKTWTNVAPNIGGAPKPAYVASIKASPVDAGTAYVTMDQHRLDDFGAYAFVTTDYGRTWRSISNGLRGYVHIVLEDPKAPNLLYAGTELGVFASFDRGQSWTDLRLGLPRLSVMDIKVHPRDDDLVIGTHARGFFVLDDVTPLREIAEALGKPATLFRRGPLPAIRRQATRAASPAACSLRRTAPTEHRCRTSWRGTRQTARVSRSRSSTACGSRFGRFAAVFTKDVAQLNERLAAAGAPQVVVDRGQDDRSRR